MEQERLENLTPPENRASAGVNPDTNASYDLEGRPSDPEVDAEGENPLRETLQRVQADFVNYKRRNDEDRLEQQKYANSRLILKLLPVLDDFNLAIEHASKSEADASWLEGIKLIQRKLSTLFESENVVRVEAEGKTFDPFEHEAMAYKESSSHIEGVVLEVVRDGYKLHDRVIRPAVVILAKEPGSTSSGSTPATEEEN